MRTKQGVIATFLNNITAFKLSMSLFCTCYFSNTGSRMSHSRYWINSMPNVQKSTVKFSLT